MGGYNAIWCSGVKEYLLRLQEMESGKSIQQYACYIPKFLAIIKMLTSLTTLCSFGGVIAVNDYSFLIFERLSVLGP